MKEQPEKQWHSLAKKNLFYELNSSEMFETVE